MTGSCSPERQGALEELRKVAAGHFIVQFSGDLSASREIQTMEECLDGIARRYSTSYSSVRARPGHQQHRRRPGLPVFPPHDVGGQTPIKEWEAKLKIQG
jgi:hypothetical protein